MRHGKVLLYSTLPLLSLQPQRLATDGLHDKSGGISFERLSAFKDAFNEVVKLSEAYAPQLNQIKVRCAALDYIV